MLPSLLSLAFAALLAADAPRAGLGAAFHSGRRAALLEELAGGVVLVRGLPPTRDFTAFRQDKTFWYLTGVESPDAALVMDATSRRQILFLPKPNRGLERWEGEQWDTGDEWVKSATGFAELRPIDELQDALRELTSETKKVWISKSPHIALSGGHDRAGPHDRRVARDPLDGRVSREAALEAKLKELPGVEVEDFAPVLARMRRVKTPEEIDAIRRASQAGAVAMSEAIRSTRPGLGEWDIEALMTFVHRRQGADGPAYHAIVGSGPNSLALHYSACTRRMQEGDVLLLDYAPEVDHYTSDITRSWPVGGKYSPRMAELTTPCSRPSSPASPP